MTTAPLRVAGSGERFRWEETEKLHARLIEDGMLMDTAREEVLSLLRRDVSRIAESMEGTSGCPPMLWSGIPFPVKPASDSSEYCLVISVGGTRTGYALMRLDRGVAYVLAPDGRELSGAEAAEIKKSMSFATPTQADTKHGLEMVEKLVEPIARYLAPFGDRLKHCSNVLFSWGFAHKVLRVSPRVLGGICAQTTRMTKDQTSFTRELLGRDMGELVREALARRLGWSAPVTVANDGIMALHYFLTAERLRSHFRFGLFINGTGTNFASAEPYAIRPEGVVSRAGEEYEPERVTRHRPLRTGEHEERYFVNYESGSIPLVATRAALDVPSEYPIEENALSGGNALPRQLRVLIERRLSSSAWSRLLEGHRRRMASAVALPRGQEVSRIALEGERAFDVLFPGAALTLAEMEGIQLICRAILTRSALHVAMLLAAVTERNGFGLGEASTGKKDLLAMEGSVWSVRGYSDLVRAFWQEIMGAQALQVDFDHEKSYDASLPGPLYLAVIHAC